LAGEQAPDFRSLAGIAGVFKQTSARFIPIPAGGGQIGGNRRHGTPLLSNRHDWIIL
jgi:hypothetical protein